VSDDHIYQVSEINQLARTFLEETFPLILVTGEVSNLSKPQSGHFYFSLKDQNAQIRCAMFRSHQTKLGFELVDGLHVVLQAQVTLYEKRGDYQLIVFNIEPLGSGLLYKKLEQLKQKLAAEGLFSEAHKKPLPRFVEKIGIITSTSGAAIKDILQVLKRRWSFANVTIYPTLVQGELAASQIVRAIKLANQKKAVEVLILARGGGSIEDLWPFNEEIVARAIFQSEIPIVTGIGHQVDFTIADLVADCRGSTPSVAAELVTPDQSELILQIKERRKKLDHLMKRRLSEVGFIFEQLKTKLNLLSPKLKLESFFYRNQNLFSELKNIFVNRLQGTKQKLEKNVAALELVNPLATLKRGYAIATSEQGILYSAASVKIGDLVNVQLSDGSLNCSVLACHCEQDALS
jgi:exodeoxyribonuclease VII large subunit